MKRAGATAKVARTAALLGLGVFLSLPQWALGQQVSLDLVDLEVYPRIKIYTTVMDRAGKPLCDLTRGDFALEEAGEPRRLRVLSGKSTETSIGILLDESGSMGDVIGAVRRAAGRFVELLGGTDRAATYSFASSTHPLHRMIDVAVGRNKAALTKSLDDYGRHGGGTRLYGAIIDLILGELMEEVNRRKAVVVLTDGGDTGGASLETAIQAAEDFRVAVFAIGMGDADPEALGQLSNATGGKFYSFTDYPTSEQLTEVYNDIRLRLECQYTLIYDTPSVCPDGEIIPIAVSVPSLGLEQEGEYKRPVNWPQLNSNFLFADGGSVSMEPPDPVECETVHLATRIAATSCSDSAIFRNIVVRAYDVRPGERLEREVAHSKPVSVQSNGDPEAVVIDWNTTGFRGGRNIKLVIEPLGLEEKNTEDNIVNASVRLSEAIHDLYIESIEYAPKPAIPCELVDLSVKIDDGSTCKGMLLHDIEVEGRDGDRVLGLGVVSLKVGEPAGVSFKWDPEGFVGRRSLTFTVDPERKFGREQTRDNNRKQELVHVSPVLHDLSAVSVSHEPKRPTVGDRVEFQLVVADQGSCPGTPIGEPVRMRLSDAETKQRLAQSEPASVKTAGREIVALTWQTDRNDAGTKHLKFTVDAEGKITEKSPPGKDNNSLDYTLEIGPMAHDLVIASVTLEPPVPVDGDPATLKVVVEDRARFPGVTLEGVRVKVFEGLQGFLLGESDSVAIHSQGKTTLAIDLDTGGLAGRRDLRIVVDPDQQIDEITPEGQDGENNNDRVVKVTIAE